MSRYSKEFKLEAIRLINENEKPITDIAKELGVKRELLYRWRDELAKKADGAFSGKPGPKSDNPSELARLRKENKDLREERDILKKAAAYFAKDLK